MSHTTIFLFLALQVHGKRTRRRDWFVLLWSQILGPQVFNVDLHRPRPWRLYPKSANKRGGKET